MSKKATAHAEKVVKHIAAKTEKHVKTVSGILSDFNAFLLNSKVVDLAIAVIIATAFWAIILSLVADIVGPIIGLAFPSGTTLEEIFVVMR